LVGGCNLKKNISVSKQLPAAKSLQLMTVLVSQLTTSMALAQWFLHAL
jgi:hypothetical protein